MTASIIFRGVAEENIRAGDLVEFNCVNGHVKKLGQKGTTMNQWSAADERQYQEMLKRRTEVLDQRESVVREVVARTFDSLMNVDYDEIVKQLIIHAEPIRDALAPYDNGERVAAPPEKSPRPNIPPPSSLIRKYREIDNDDPI